VTGSVFTSGGENLGRTNYTGVSGGIGMIGNGWDQWAGYFYSQSKTTIANTPDGSSNSLMFGETIGDDQIGKTYSHSWMGVGNLPTAYGFVPSAWYTFGSKHTGVVLFSMGDGSVRGIKRSADVRIIRSAAGIGDGEVYDANSI
jgi:hypothetical protein